MTGNARTRLRDILYQALEPSYEAAFHSRINVEWKLRCREGADALVDLIDGSFQPKNGKRNPEQHAP